MVFLKLFGAFLFPKWSLKRIDFRFLSSSKKWLFFDWAFIAFGRSFWSPDSWKWAPRRGETLIFTESLLSIRARFLMQTMCQRACKMIPNGVKNQSENRCDFALDQASILDPKWRQNGPTIGAKNHEKRNKIGTLFQWPVHGVQMDAKGHRNEAKWGPMDALGEAN